MQKKGQNTDKNNGTVFLAFETLNISRSPGEKEVGNKRLLSLFCKNNCLLLSAPSVGIFSAFWSVCTRTKNLVSLDLLPFEGLLTSLEQQSSISETALSYSKLE